MNLISNYYANKVPSYVPYLYDPNSNINRFPPPAPAPVFVENPNTYGKLTTMYADLGNKMNDINTQNIVNTLETFQNSEDVKTRLDTVMFRNTLLTVLATSVVYYIFIEL
jgi:hypothetical protein